MSLPNAYKMVKHHDKDETPIRLDAYNTITSKVVESSEELRYMLATPEGQRVIEVLFGLWSSRVVNLDDKCLQLYANGLCKHDGKGFTDIHRAEKHWLPSTRTVSLHLGHLKQVGLVGRHPWKGRENNRSRYYFHMPPIPTKKLSRSTRRYILSTKGIEIDEELLLVNQLVTAPLRDTKDEHKVKELTDRIWTLYFVYGIHLADSLERALSLKPRGKSDKMFQDGLIDRQRKADWAAYVLLTENRRIAKDAALRFREQVRHMGRITGLMK